MFFIKKLLPLYIAISMFSYFEIHAQEANFSMYHYSPVFTNPGAIGTEENVRIMLNYRNQSIDLDRSFTTSSFSIFYPIYIGKHRIVTAASFLNDKSSDFLAINGGIISLAYSLQTTSNSALSLGIQTGYFQRSPGGNYTTDDQYIDGAFVPGSVSGDATLQFRKSYPAFSGGLYYKVKNEDGLEKAFIGAAIFNINKPNISLVNNRADDLPMALKSTAGYRLYYNKNISVVPTARWVGRAGNHFFNLGSRFAYELNKGGVESKKIELGIWYHTNNLGVFSLAYEQANITIAASYDHSVGSELSVAQNNIAELAISFRLKKKNRPSFSKTSPQLLEVIESKEEVAVKKTEEAEQEIPISSIHEEKGITHNELPKEQAEQEITEIYPDNKSVEILTAAEKEVLSKTVKFDFNSENLDDESQIFLNEVAAILQNKENFNIELTGHSCNLGPEDINQELSLKRAGIVKEYLVTRGIAKDRFTVKGMGESDPLDDNSTQDGREHNRRVEFNVVYEK